jgi:DNA-binding MarR family transcriptional regulator
MPTNRRPKTENETVQNAQETHLDDALGFLFRRLSGYADSIFMTTTEQTQLTPMQMGVLLTVNNFEHLSLRELARRMHVDRSTIQELVTRMQKKGLVRSRTSKVDRRTYELWLTPLGVELLTRYEPCVKATQEHLLKDFKPGERQRLIRDLKKILRQEGD